MTYSWSCSIYFITYGLSHFSYVRLFATIWTVARQAPLSVGFSRQEHWSGLPCPLQRIFLTQGLNPSLLNWQVDSLSSGPPGKPSVLPKQSAGEPVSQAHPRGHSSEKRARPHLSVQGAVPCAHPPTQAEGSWHRLSTEGDTMQRRADPMAC